MASYEVSENQTLTVNLLDDFTDQGWIVSQGTAFHSGCNSGYIRLNVDLSSYGSWTFVYTIQSITSGIVRIVVDGVSGIDRTSAGTYEETFSSSNPNAVIEFYATGISAVSSVSIFSPETANDGRTLAFNEDANRWVTDYSFVPEFMIKFINSFFSFQNGQLWEHNVNPIRNNFYGVQYPSIVTFYVNIEPTVVKNFYTIRLKSNKVWTATNIYIPPREGKSKGQVSRLKKGRFRSYQGDWFAEFMRDINDPRFINELDALTKGALLQGNWMEITLENTDTTEVRMMSVDVQVSPSQYTY